jgi:hypothetical protein
VAEVAHQAGEPAFGARPRWSTQVGEPAPVIAAVAESSTRPASWRR